jgi:nascent polypeptide-associated complex subunit alpha
MKISNRELRRLMKRAGIKLEEVSGAKNVDIHLEDGRIIRIKEPVVTKMEMPGQTMYQIIGKEEIVEAEEEVKIEISEEDIKIVMEQTGVDRELAVKALEMTEGDIAQAIMLIKEANL